MAPETERAGTGLREEHEAAGARFQELRGVERPRHYGDPAAEYRAAVEAAGVVDRSHRARWRVVGRDPARMLDGIVTNTVPPPLSTKSSDAARGVGAYGLVLTPKGKIVTDHRLFRWSTADEGFLLDLPPAGLEGLRDHLKKFLPPRFARVEEITDGTGMLTVLGPEAADLVAREALGLRVGEDELDALNENDFVLVGRSADAGVRVVRTGDVATPAFDVVADVPTVEALWHRLRETGAAAVGSGAWESLRVEAGRPAFGSDMDDATIPVEAGVHDRAIDYEKGCYTGQEVIVRIRDRGRVNWHLRGLLLGDVPAPEPETELFEPDGDEERAVGRITTAVESPRFGQVAALGYVRREVEPPAEVRLGSPGGEPVEVRELDGKGRWGTPEEGAD